MTISYYGEGCFKIQIGNSAVLIDPPNSASGLSLPRFKHDILIKTLSSLENLEFQPKKENSEHQIIGPGEYNIQELDINGFVLNKESSNKFLKTIYLLKAESLKLCLLGHISEPLDPSVIEHLENIDILFIPAGGKPFLEQKLAVKLIKQIEPKIIIPTFFKIPGPKRPSADIKEFLEEVNNKPQQAEKLSIKKKDLSEIKKAQIIQLTTG